jgi:hypothetical protein
MGRKDICVRLAGRLAVEPGSANLHGRGFTAPPNADNRLYGYHGVDVVVCSLSERGFEAELAAEVPCGSLVRLRLPGAGMIVAKVEGAQSGRLRAAFINPVNPSRLGKALGLGSAMCRVAA